MSLLAPQLLHWQQLLTFAPKNRTKSFLLGKCKVAPLKQIIVPKLELEAAVLGTRLRTLIQTEMTLKFEKVYLWTDSRVVLDWISSTN